LMRLVLKLELLLLALKLLKLFQLLKLLLELLRVMSGRNSSMLHLSNVTL